MCTKLSFIWFYALENTKFTTLIGVLFGVEFYFLLLLLGPTDVGLKVEIGKECYQCYAVYGH